MIRSHRVTHAECSVWEQHPPITTVKFKRTGVTFDGPDDEGDLSIEIEGYGDREVAYVPLDILANHLRQAGWTVTPPKEEP